MATTKVPYRPSPVGVAVYPWINKPDTKFNEDGVYKCGLRLEGEAAQAFKAVIDKAAAEGFEAKTEDLTPGERKKFAVYAPYDVEEDAEGTPTGAIVFHFRQNASILVEGERKPIRIAIYDAADKEAHVQVFGGTTLRIMFKPRPIKLPSNKQAGVRLDFLKVQVIKLADRNAESGFGAYEGGYVHEDEPAGGGFGKAEGGATEGQVGGDY